MEYQTLLNDLASRFRLAELPASGSLVEPTIGLMAPGEILGQDGTLTLADPTRTVSTIERTVTLDLRFVAKQVRLPSRDLGDAIDSEIPIGGMPIVGAPIVDATQGVLWQLPDTAVMDSEAGKEAVPGVPALLGRLAGTVAVPVEQVTEAVTPRPVLAGVRWRVLDDGTNRHAGDVKYVEVQDGQRGEYVPLPDPVEVAPAGSPSALGLQFPIQFTELRSATPKVRHVSVHASIQLVLDLGDGKVVRTSWIELPALPLVIPTVPVPVVLALFEHKDFSGRAFVNVPSGSLVGANSAVPGAISVGAALELTASVLRSVAPDHHWLTFFTSVAGQQLLKMVPAAAQTIFAAESRIDNLGTDEYAFNVGTLGVGRLTVEDIVSSVICIGPQGTVVDLHDTRDNPPDVTPLQTTIGGDLGIVIKNLNTMDPAAEVAFGGEITRIRPDTNFNDKISSLLMHSA